MWGVCMGMGRELGVRLGKLALEAHLHEAHLAQIVKSVSNIWPHYPHLLLLLPLEGALVVLAVTVNVTSSLSPLFTNRGPYACPANSQTCVSAQGGNGASVPVSAKVM